MNTELWFPVVTLLVGLGAGYLVDWHKDKRNEKRERDDRWKAFQRETILEAQDLMWQRHLADTEVGWAASQHLRTTGQWPKPIHLWV